MDVLPLLQHIEPRTFQGGTRNIPAHAEKEDFGAHHVVLGVVTICLGGCPGCRAILWTHSGGKEEAGGRGEDRLGTARESSRGPREVDRGDWRVADAGACG